MLSGWRCLTASLGFAALSFSVAAECTASFAHEALGRGAEGSCRGQSRRGQSRIRGIAQGISQRADLHLFLGISQLRLRDPDAAVLRLSGRLINPNHVEARTLLGWVELEIRGDIPAAIKEYPKVVELKPDSAEPIAIWRWLRKIRATSTRRWRVLTRRSSKPDYVEALTTRGWARRKREMAGGAARFRPGTQDQSG